jgi:thiol-disulfide isomerase/thioredoxin
VKFRDPHYGDLEVFTGKASRAGEVVIRGISDRILVGTVAAPYRIAVEDQKLGSFGLTEGKPTQVFTFQLAPRAGDVAPDIDLVNVATGVHSKLHDFRGKVVCLEIWATWCGPCQPAMQRLNQMAVDHRAAWRNRVAIIPLSIDERPEAVARHVKPRQWDQVDHYWTGADGAMGADSPACRALVIQGVPELLIIDRHGRISWIGHPEGTDVASRIQGALER